MHHCGQRAALALALAASLATIPATLSGQTPARVRPPQHDWAISARAGYALPFSDLGRAQDGGPSFGLGFERIVEHTDRDAPLWAVRLDGDVDLLSGIDAPSGPIPDLTFYRYTLGVEYWFTQGRRSTFRLRGRVAFGASTLKAKDPPPDSNIGGTFPNLVFGLNAGLGVVFVETQWVSMFNTGRLGPEIPVGGRFRRLNLLGFKAGVRIPL